MPKRRTLSLSGLRAAVLAARHGSLAKAAAELAVSPSAVSHQVRKLEEELEVALFERHANFLRSTLQGRSFLERATAAIAMIDEAAEALHRNAEEIRVQASPSLALRWLIPALGRLSESYPRLRVQIETTADDEAFPGRWDVLIAYRRKEEAGTGKPLVADLVLPMVSPRLSDLIHYRSGGDLRAIPALHSALGDWDWRLWCRSLAIEAESIQIGHAFDTDDAAIRGAVAGLGMVLASPLLTQAEMRDGTLMPLPGFEPVELGRYEVKVRDRERRSVRQFCGWLAKEAGRAATLAETGTTKPT